MPVADPLGSRALRHTHQNPGSLQPGKIYETDIEIWATAWLFPAGHGIRVELAPGVILHIVRCPSVTSDVVAAKVLAALEAQVVTVPIALRDAADEARDSLGDVLPASDFHATLKPVLEIQQRRRASRHGLLRRNHHDQFDAPDWVGVTLRPPSQGASRTHSC